MCVWLVTLDFMRFRVNRLNMAESAQWISALVGKTLGTTKPIMEIAKFPICHTVNLLRINTLD